MFDRREYRSFRGVRAEQLDPGVHDFWAKEGFSVVRASPWRIEGESFDSRIGLRRKFSLTMHEQEGTTYMDLQVQAKVTDLGIVGGVIVAVICLPIAAIGGLVSYHEYEKDAGLLNYRFWDYMGLVARSQGGTPY